MKWLQGELHKYQLLGFENFFTIVIASRDKKSSPAREKSIDW